MKAHVTTIAKMLESNIEYVIPQFQRAYAWSYDQWRPLWDDIQNVAQHIANAPDPEAVPPHFMGSVVLQERDGHTDAQESYIVVDGQQRLTTIIIILRALANAGNECDLLDLEEQFVSYVQNYDGQKYFPKVRHLNRSNYNDLKVVLEMFSVGTDVTSRMSMCHDFFHDRAVRHIRRDDNTEQNCQNLLDVLRYKLETAVLILERNEQPNKVFETLNARNEPLTQSELIKNTIMYEGSVIEDAHRANVLWGDEMDHPYYGRESQDGGHLDQFFADWLTSVNRNRIPRDRTSTEFRHYLTEVNNDGLGIDYVTRNMKQAAEIFRKVRANDFPESQPSTTRLMSAGTGFFMPVVLWLWSEEKEIERSQRQAILRIVESYVVRRILTDHSISDAIASNITGMLNAMQASLNSGNEPQEAAYNWIIRNRTEAIRWPTDDEVINKISNDPHEMTATRRNMVLQALENHLRIDNGQRSISGGFQTTILIPDSENGLTSYPIEGRPTQARLERRNRIVKQLGNFTLSSNRLTTREQNAGWSDKQIALERRGKDVLLNQRLLSPQQTTFTEQDIVNRSRWMAELCVAVWPRNQE